MDRKALIDRVVNDPTQPEIDLLTMDEILIVLGLLDKQRRQSAEQLHTKMDTLDKLKRNLNQSPASPVVSALVQITSEEEAMLGAFRACDRFTKTLLFLMADHQAKT